MRQFYPVTSHHFICCGWPWVWACQSVLPTGVWTACGVALVAIVARVLFHDPLTPKMAIGITFIIAGVLAIELAGVPGVGAS